MLLLIFLLSLYAVIVTIIIFWNYSHQITMQCSSHHITSIVSVVVLRVFNRFRVIRENTLKRLMFHRPKGKGLLTVSNHQSVVDDPGLWGALLPFWRISPEQMRWSLCTDDIFFYVCISIYFR